MEASSTIPFRAGGHVDPFVETSGPDAADLAGDPPDGRRGTAGEEAHDAPAEQRKHRPSDREEDRHGLQRARLQPRANGHGQGEGHPVDVHAVDGIHDVVVREAGSSAVRRGVDGSTHHLEQHGPGHGHHEQDEQGRGARGPHPPALQEGTPARRHGPVVPRSSGTSR